MASFLESVGFEGNGRAVHFRVICHHHMDQIDDLAAGTGRILQDIGEIIGNFFDGTQHHVNTVDGGLDQISGILFHVIDNDFT